MGSRADAVRTRIRSRDGGAKLNSRGVRCPSRRPHSRDHEYCRRILWEEDVRRACLHGQRSHVLRRSENRSGVTAYAGTSHCFLVPTSYQTDGLHRQADEINDLRERDRHGLRKSLGSLGSICGAARPGPRWKKGSTSSSHW